MTKLPPSSQQSTAQFLKKLTESLGNNSLQLMQDLMQEAIAEQESWLRSIKSLPLASQEMLVNLAFLRRNQHNLKPSSDETRSLGGVCMGLVAMWILAENSAKQYSVNRSTPQSFRENYNMIAEGYRVKGDTIQLPKHKLPPEMKQQTDEFLEQITTYQWTSTPEGLANYSNLELLKDKIPLNPLSKDVLDFSQSNLEKNMDYLIGMQQRLNNSDDEIFISLCTINHIMILKISAEAFTFYDPSKGEPIHDIKEIVRHLNQMDAKTFYKHENLKLIRLEAFTVGSPEYHQKIQKILETLPAPKLIEEEMKGEDIRSSIDFCIRLRVNHTAKNLLQGKPDSFIKDAMIAALGYKNFDIFSALLIQHESLLNSSEFSEKLIKAFNQNHNEEIINVFKPLGDTSSVMADIISKAVDYRHVQKFLELLRTELSKESLNTKKREVYSQLERVVNRYLDLPNQTNLQIVRSNLNRIQIHFQGDRSELTRKIKDLGEIFSNKAEAKTAATNPPQLK